MIADAIRAALTAAFSSTTGVSVAISGSIARGTPRLERTGESRSDVDVLVFVEDARATERLRLPSKISCVAPVAESIELDGSFILTTQSRVLAGPTPDSFIDASKGEFLKDDLALQAELSKAIARQPTDDTYRYRVQPVAYYWAKWLSTGIEAYRERALARLKEIQPVNESHTLTTATLPRSEGVNLGALDESELVVSTLVAYLDRLGVQPLGSTAAVLAYNARDSSPDNLFRLVQRRSFIENHGLEPHEAVRAFVCELLSDKECQEHDENRVS